MNLWGPLGGQTRYSGEHSALRSYNGSGEPYRQLYIQDLFEGAQWTVTEVAGAGAVPTIGRRNLTDDLAAVEHAPRRTLSVPCL